MAITDKVAIKHLHASFPEDVSFQLRCSTPILMMRKLRLGEVKRLVESLTASEWQNWEWKFITPGCFSIALFSEKPTGLGPPYPALLEARDRLHQGWGLGGCKAKREHGSKRFGRGGRFSSALAGNSKNVPPQGPCLILGSASSQLESQLSQVPQSGSCRTHLDHPPALDWFSIPGNIPSSLGDYRLLRQQPRVPALSSSLSTREASSSAKVKVHEEWALSLHHSEASATLFSMTPNRANCPIGWSYESRGRTIRIDTGSEHQSAHLAAVSQES